MRRNTREPGPSPRTGLQEIAVTGDTEKCTRFVVAYEAAGDPCRKALHRPLAQIVVESAADVGALVTTLLGQGADRLRVTREEVLA